MKGVSKCFYCNAEAISDCSDCHLVSFCADKQHQLIHKDSERKKCLPFKVIQDPVKGQCVIATRIIKPLEMILAELPAVIGPYAWPGKHQCLECFRVITDVQAHKCSKCHYPVCNKQSCQNGNWHRLECQIFQDVNHHCDYQDPHLTPYAAITPLRFLCITKDKKASLSETLFTLRDHNIERRNSDPDLWGKHEDRVAHFLVNVCKMAPNVEMVHRVMGILATNSANLDMPNDSKEASYGRGCGLYPTYAKVNHNCHANTKNMNHSQFNKLQLCASDEIQSGAEISNLYVQAMSSTLPRRHQLRSKWHFDCRCVRCADPYEMGSNLSTLKCTADKCSGNLVSSNPLDPMAMWNCDLCKIQEPFHYAIACMNEAKAKLKVKTKENIINMYERFLHEQESVFHPNHHTMLDVKMHLSLLYGNLKMYSILQMNHPQLERKQQCLKDVLSTLTKVEIGYSSRKGKMMNELMKTVLCKAQRDFIEGKLSPKDMEKILMEQKADKAYITLNQSAYSCN